MSNHSWDVSLQQAIRRANKPRPRIAVVGIGHELRGDDAAGIMIARGLQRVSSPTLIVVDAGPAPENFTGLLRALAPDVVLLVDAAQMQEPPGTVRLLAIDGAQPDSASTHTLSLHLLANFLRATLDGDILLLGIQPEQDSFGTGLSSAVQQSVDHIVTVLPDIAAVD
ncbi:MAG: hydrogenase maturation peptidase HycI, partial [Anaerolineae bacterium]|nr:hydrogenase maturation peptidase HycI [Anaerolineae bacterium]